MSQYTEQPLTAPSPGTCTGRPASAAPPAPRPADGWRSALTATARDATTPAAQTALAAVVCDEQLLFADAFAAALRERGVRVVSTADAALTAKIAVRDAAASVIINPEPSMCAALVALREIRSARPETRLICLCSEACEATGQALAGYVDVVVSKRRPLRELVDIVVGGPAPLAGVVPDSGPWPRRQREPTPPLAAQFLNQRELQVLRLVAAAESTHEIARRLGITVPTARGYIQSIFSKLGVHSRVEVLNYAVRHSLVEL